MKKHVILAIFSILIGENILKSQSLINPYEQYNGFDSPRFDNLPFYQYQSYKPTSIQFNGEYEILINDHFWSTIPSISSLPKLNAWEKTSIIEVVSFPFDLHCQPNTSNLINCSDYNPNDRQLYMPSGNFDPISRKWGNVYIVSPEATYDGFQFKYDIAPNCTTNRYTTLVSRLFNSNLPNYECLRVFLPHTILKHTINLYCPGTSDIVSSQVFIIDNTRGRMNYYPFYPNNLPASIQDLHDITIMPELLFDNVDNNVIDIFYQADPAPINNSLWLGSANETVDYYPSREIMPCSSYTPSAGMLFASNPSGNFDYYFPHPPSYTLLSAYPKDSHGRVLAGYTFSSNFPYTLTQRPSWKHVYNIDKGFQQGFKIQNINPNEKVIYNPSEVNINNFVDVNNLINSLIFPNYYTFLTVRGKYPPASQLALDNITENGGYFNDLRKVPVRTDLRFEGTAYPNNPATPAHSVYASIYNMQNGSRIDVQDCVGLFDLTFDVNQGASLVMNTYPNIKGREQFGDNTSGRFKIKTHKGAVLRNYKPVQYVQNGDITQNYPLEYIAINQIICGNNVDTEDVDAVQGDYEIKPNAEVVFRAGNSITLKPGFHAQSGSNFLATTSIIPVPVACNQQTSNPVNTRTVHTGYEPQVLNSSKFRLYPNPANERFTLEYDIDENAVTEIYNSMGNKVAVIALDPSTKSYEASTVSYTPGIYHYRIHTTAGKVLHAGKLVVAK